MDWESSGGCSAVGCALGCPVRWASRRSVVPSNSIWAGKVLMSMNDIQVLGRSAGDPNDAVGPRAKARPGPRITIPYTSGAIGDVTVQVFTSVDDEDRGGVIIRLAVNDGGSSFIPAAQATATGVDIHMAGDAEAACLIRALRAVLSALPEPRFRERE